MVRSNGWLGLPGGKVKENECDGNLMATDAYPALAREVKEECGFDISEPLRQSSACLGIVTDLIRVDSEAKTIKEMFVPVFLCKAPDLSGGSKDIVWRDLSSNSFEKVYPDARLALKYLQQKVKSGMKGPIIPEFLNHKIIYFQTRPSMRYLPTRPEWTQSWAD
jgi:8-oxo-dGTP pyrophosphatase MutT (NUDIX family)